LESIEFIVIIAAFAIILFWYLQNAEADSAGARGWLALTGDPDAAAAKTARKSYRIKTRIARRAHEMCDVTGVKTAACDVKPAYRTIGEGERMRRAFRRQDEARYRAKDKAARYKPRSGPTTTA